MEFEDQKEALQQTMKHDKMQEESMHKASVERLLALKNDEITKCQESIIDARQQHAAEVCTLSLVLPVQLTSLSRLPSCERKPC